MQSGVELKYIILFAILVALTGFTFESQFNDPVSEQQPRETTVTLHAAR